MKPARLRPAATSDLLDVGRWYAERGGPALAERFFDSARHALASVERSPSIGSKRLGRRAGIEGLRSWGVSGFPVRWFYLDADDHLDGVRLLGERQNMGRILRHEEA